MNGRSRRSGYTLTETLVTIAVLVIVLGLMVSLARLVRARSARMVTQAVLFKLNQAMADYVAQNGGALPAIPELMDPEAAHVPDEATLLHRALVNNTQFVRLLRAKENLDQRLSGLPVRLYVYGQINPRLDDDWGNPIVFMSRANKYIGMAPYGRPFFFFSAGPDGKYLTRADNLYSYEPGSGGP